MEKRDFYIPYDVIVDVIHALKDSDIFSNTVQKISRSKHVKESAYSIHLKVSEAYAELRYAVSIDYTRKDIDETPRGKIDRLREWEKTLSDKERDAIARSVKSIEKQLSTLAGN